MQKGGLDSDVRVYSRVSDWGAWPVAVLFQWQLPVWLPVSPPLPNVRLQATLLPPPHPSLSSPDAGHRTQARPGALKPGFG